jgi:predicted permease
VSGNYFPVLGVPPALGRLIQEEDDRAGAPHVAVLSHSFWQTRFAGDAGVIGTLLELDGRPATIVGVAKRGFFGVDPSVQPAVFLPLASDRPTTNVWIAGRLRPGVSIAVAEAWLAPLFARGLASMEQQTERRSLRDREGLRRWRPRLARAGNGTLALRSRIATPLRIVAGAMLLVLAISCTNVTALQLSRGERRASEIALRLSLGAGRARVVRQLVTEGLLLAALAGGFGLGLALVLHRLLVALSPLHPSAVLDFRLDLRVLGFALVVSTAAGVLTAIVPALRLSRVDTFAVLKTGSGSAAGWRSGPRKAFLVAEVAATFVVLAGAGLLLRSLDGLRRIDTGFDRRSVLLARVHPSASRFRDSPAATWALPLQEQLSRIAGVRSVALAANRVYTGGPPWILDVWVQGHSYPLGGKHAVGFNDVGPGFFATLGVPLLAGRELTASDRAGTPEVALVNLAFARRYFGRATAVGHRLGTSADAPGRYEIVGVVADSRVESLTESPWPTVYLPLLQRGSTGPVVAHVRANVPPAALAAAIRREVARFDTDLEVRSLDTLEAVIDGTLRRERMVAALLSLLAAVALVLTAIGLYGTMSYAAARRKAEIGVRAALGASEHRIVAWMLEEASSVVVLGVAIGVPLAAFGLQSLRTLVFDVPTLDPVSLALALLVVFVVGLTAAALPARAAARVGVAEALRQD